MNITKIKTTGLSLNEVRQKYPDCFYKQIWYNKERFANENPEAGEYEFYFDNIFKNQTYQEQALSLQIQGNGFDFPHPAVLAEALCIYFKETGERLMSDVYSRTSLLDSDGDRVSVGGFDADGLYVGRYWDDGRNSGLGVSASRKVDIGNLEPLDPIESLKVRILELEKFKSKVEKTINL